MPDLADLSPGEVGGFLVAGTTVLACRVGDELFAYQRSVRQVRRVVGRRRIAPPDGRRRSGHAVLRCPRCHAHFDVVHAGASADRDADVTEHLDPIPLLVRDGVLSMAVLDPTAVA